MAKSGIAFKPTKADIETVKSMTLLGSREDTIAKCIGKDGIALSTLRTHFGEILATHRERVLAKIAQGTIYQEALPVSEGGKGNIQAAMFVLKCRAGWREQDPNMNIAADKVMIVKRVIGVSDEDV